MQRNRKAITPIVASILLIVVAVILVTIVLNWGRGFTNQGLEGTNKILKETTKNYMIGSPKINAQGVLSFKNITPGDEPITITGYQIISSDDSNNFNVTIDIDDVNISPGGTYVFSIPEFPPENKITIQLITDENEYISVGSITNIPEEQQDIPVELSPLDVNIYSPTDSNNWEWGQWPTYNYNSYKDFNATTTGGTGEYTCSWNLKRYDGCTLYFIEDIGVVSNSCNFNRQLIHQNALYYFELTVSSSGVEDAIDGIVFGVGSDGDCEPCP